MYLRNGTFLQGGKYKIIKKLGQGGFGITYLAQNTKLDGEVAIKEFFFKDCCERDAATSCVTITSATKHDVVERFKQKFLKEAQKIFSLNHPHIVRILDIFDENNTAYYVMEYAAKGSLGDRVKTEGYLSEPVATRYILQVAEALDYIHQQNVTHLDVKPANIMLNEKDEAVLIDFGLSKQYDAASGSETSATPVGISEGYAPMEQYMTGGVGAFSPETDIYALGATFYKLLTGTTPANASTVFDNGLDIAPLKAKGVSDKAIATIANAMRPRKTDRTKSVRTFIDQLKSTTPLPPPTSGNEDTLVFGRANGGASNGNGNGGANNGNGGAGGYRPAEPPAPNGNTRLIIIAIITIAVAVILGVVLLLMNSGGSTSGGGGVPSDSDVAVIDTISNITPTEESVQEPQQKMPVYVVVNQNMMVRTGPSTKFEAKPSPYNDIYNNYTNSAIVSVGTRIKAIEESNGFVHAIQLSPNNDRDEWGEGWVSKKNLELIGYE